MPDEPRPPRKKKKPPVLTHFGGSEFWNEYPWLPFVGPFFVYLLIASLTPKPDTPGGAFGLTIPYSAYPWFYGVQIGLTLVAVGLCWRVYREFSFRITLLSVVVGVVGIVLWIGLCKLGLEQRLLVPIGLGSVVEQGERAGYNPFEQLSGAGQAYAYLSVRFFGLVLLVPLIEEFFLRGFVMRYLMARDWLDVPFGVLTAGAIAVAPIYGVLTHPAEAFAAAAWFGLVTWLMIKTRSIWDCVVAHAVTNLLLGVWVLATGEWYFL